MINIIKNIKTLSFLALGLCFSNILSNNIKKQIENCKKPVVVKFYTDWCGACKSFKPVFEKVKNKLSNKCEFIEVNVDNNRKLAQEYEIEALPTCVFIKNNKVKEKVEGSLDQNTLNNKIKNNF